LACTPHDASAAASVVNGFVVGVTITDGGCGYTNSPSVSFIGGSGNGAEATAVVSNGVVVGVVITSTGTGYTSTPSVYIASTFGWAPQVIREPQARTVNSGDSAVFTVMASGASPLSYQWQKDGVSLTDGGNVLESAASTLVLSAVKASDAGNYTVIITNAYGSVTSSVAALTVLGAPVITLQPQAQTVGAGSNVVWCVSAMGVLPLSFQWAFDGTNIAGATNGSLALTNVQFEQSGVYSVAITNSLGFAISTNFALAVLSPPQILTQPANEVAYWGQDATLEVAAEGTAPLAYQWYLNGLPIGWGTNAVLSFPSLDLTNAGAYSVQVTNLYGSAVSQPVNLLVNPAGVSLGLYAGLTLSGTVGKSFDVLYAPILDVSTNWTTITNVTLTEPVQIWVDTSTDVSHGGRRFYRVVAHP
jgi:hypothetical protein